MKKLSLLALLAAAVLLLGQCCKSRTDHLKWTLTMPGAIITGGSIGPDSTLYMLCHEGRYACAVKNGSLIGTYPTVDGPFCSVVGADGTVYVACDYGSLLALTPQLRSLIWRYQSADSGATGLALANDGTIYLSTEHRLAALSPDGSLKWECNLQDTLVLIRPNIGAGGVIYFPTVTGGLHALNPDGTLRWVFPARTGEAVVGADGTVYACADGLGVVAVDTNGNEVWHYAGITGTSNPTIGPYGTIYVGTDDGWLYALNPDGTEKWRVEAGGRLIASPTVGADGTIFTYGTYGGRVSAFDFYGNLLWYYTPRATIYSGPTLAEDSTLFVGTADSTLYALDAGTTMAWGPWATSGHDLRRTHNAQAQ